MGEFDYEGEGIKEGLQTIYIVDTSNLSHSLIRIE